MMLNKTYKLLVAGAMFYILPSVASAGVVLGGSKAIFKGALDLVNTVLIPLVFSLALLTFFYGIVKYIWSEGNGKEDGRKVMIWGVVALFVMSSVWGLVYFIRKELDIKDTSSTPIPTIGSELI